MAEDTKVDDTKQDSSSFTGDGKAPIDADILKALGATDDEVEEESGVRPATAPPRKFLNRFDKVEDLEEHARHFQSESDKQRSRADALERDLSSMRQTEEWRILESLKADPDKRDRLRAIIAGDETPTLDMIDPVDLTKEGTPSNKWLQAMIRAEARKLVKTEIEPTTQQIRQQQEASALIQEFPELASQETQAPFVEFVKERGKGVQGLALRDFYQLYLATKGGAPSGQRDDDRRPDPQGDWWRTLQDGIAYP